MFTGIIESLSVVTRIEKEGSNFHFTFKNKFTSELKIDQSVAHNGVCLTVIDVKDDEYTVTAIDETMKRTNMLGLEVGSIVNFERCTKVGSRLDGHIVQGHVDQVAVCSSIEFKDGSWDFYFAYEPSSNITVEKGSITINGVSLTVVNSEINTFSVSIIPYTFDNTCFKDFKVGTKVNLEFDIVGKYVAKLFAIKNA
jgi:riboflavin synthase